MINIWSEKKLVSVLVRGVYCLCIPTMMQCNQDKIIMHYMAGNAAGATNNCSDQQLLIAHHLKKTQAKTQNQVTSSGPGGPE